jgi:dihydrofolate synthase/folylpolyglutamate synthase
MWKLASTITSKVYTPRRPFTVHTTHTTAHTTTPSYPTLLYQLLTINRTRAVRLGLTSTTAIFTALGKEYQPTFKIIHVAGTNGKGSVSHKIARALELQGLKVGLFTSPHISSFRERIQINSTLISEHALCTVIPPIIACTVQQNIPATFFELTTVVGVKCFNEAQVDVGVIEVGLG